MNMLSYVQKKWIAKKLSPFKLLKWAVGDEYRVVYVRPSLEDGKQVMRVTFEPADQMKGFRQQMTIPENTFLDCFESSPMGKNHVTL